MRQPEGRGRDHPAARPGQRPGDDQLLDLLRALEYVVGVHIAFGGNQSQAITGRLSVHYPMGRPLSVSTSPKLVLRTHQWTLTSSFSLVTYPLRRLPVRRSDPSICAAEPSPAAMRGPTGRHHHAHDGSAERPAERRSERVGRSTALPLGRSALSVGEQMAASTRAESANWGDGA